ncbi:unnamed protein product [Urochloa humidicola]
MPRAKVSGDLLQGIKGISIRDSEGHEFRVDLTQTQPPDVPRDDAAGIKGAAAPCGVDKSVPTATGHFSSDDELHGPPVGVQGSQSSSQRRRVAVRKVSAHRLSQETSSQDDFVDAPPLKKQKPDANKSTVPIGRTGLRTSPRSMTKQASVINKNQEINKYPTIRCAPGSITTILESMSKPMKDRLVELGFNDFLRFNVDAIDDRGLILFLMEHAQLDPLRIEVSGRVLPVTPQVVKCVLGIPDGPNPLPSVSALEKNSHQKELRRLCDLKGMKQMFQQRKQSHPKCKAYSQLKSHEVDRWVIEEFAKNGDGDDWSITCFFMSLFDGLLFPTSSLTLSDGSPIASVYKAKQGWQGRSTTWFRFNS